MADEFKGPSKIAYGKGASGARSDFLPAQSMKLIARYERTGLFGTYLRSLTVKEVVKVMDGGASALATLIADGADHRAGERTRHRESTLAQIDAMSQAAPAENGPIRMRL
jgi:hypothetical protein